MQADLVRQIGAWGSMSASVPDSWYSGEPRPQAAAVTAARVALKPTPRLGVGSQAKPVLGNFWRIGRTVRRDAVIPGRLRLR